MTGCSAEYCCNSSQKGFHMYRFPKNEVAKKLWMQKVNRCNWVPGPYSSLCDVHFADNMFYIAANGKLRRKYDAVPTLFGKEIAKTSSHFNSQKDSSNNDGTDKDENTAIEFEDNMDKIESNSYENSETTALDLNIFNEEGIGADRLSVEDKSFANDDCCRMDKDNSAVEQDRTMHEMEKRLCEMENKFQRADAMLMKSERSRIKTVKKLIAAKKIIKKLENQINDARLKQGIRKILNDDQSRLLDSSVKKIPRWCNATLIKAYKLKFVCGTAGYEELLNQNFPLPSIRTLRRKLENLQFNSGILEEIVKFLEIKISRFVHEIDKDCILILDEMSITPATTYDLSTNKMCGNVTLPGHDSHDSSETATHALVFLLAGLSARWKQTIAYYFTGNKVNGECLQPIIKEIIFKAESIGLKVHVVTSDMGPTNQAMWRSYGVYADRFSINNSCAHPCDENRKLFFYADVPHAFKNIKNGFISMGYIVIPDSFVEKEKLPNNIAKSEYLKDILDADQDCDIKLVSKLKEEHLDTKNHLKKMKVSNATKIFCSEVSSALELLTDENLNDERLTTSWFVDFVSRWFEIMSNRKMSLALGHLNEAKYCDTIDMLYECIDLFKNIKVGKDGRWKPYQSAVLLSTKTVLELSDYLLNTKEYKFFLTSRLTQDCLENLFSVVRMKNVIPNALQLKNNLKLICISQYMKNIAHTNYEQDDREFLSEFLDILMENRCSSSHFVDNDVIAERVPDLSDKIIVLNKLELNKLYYIAGYIISNILKNQRTCDECVQGTMSNKMECYSFNLLTRIRNRKYKCLFFVNSLTFRFFIQMEKAFRIYYPCIRLNKNINLKQFFLQKFGEIVYCIPDCHQMKNKIISRFAVFRLKIQSKQIKSKHNYTYASKSIAMHQRVQ